MQTHGDTHSLTHSLSHSLTLTHSFTHLLSHCRSRSLCPSLSHTRTHTTHTHTSSPSHIAPNFHSAADGYLNQWTFSIDLVTRDQYFPLSRSVCTALPAPRRCGRLHSACVTRRVVTWTQRPSAMRCSNWAFCSATCFMCAASNVNTRVCTHWMRHVSHWHHVRRLHSEPGPKDVSNTGMRLCHGGVQRRNA